MSLTPTGAPSTITPSSPQRAADSGAEEGGFRKHLARALSGAAGIAAGVGTVTPGAGAVATGLGGLSRMLDADATGSRSSDDLERALTESRSMNSRYIELQARMQAESQAFTAVSNVLRARHESAQTALNNIR